MGGKRKVKWRDGRNEVLLKGSSSNGKVTKHGNSKKSQLTLLSVGEELRSSRVLVKESDPRANSYVEVKIGKPMVIEYVHFRLYSDDWEGGDNELMISTFMESRATKQAAAEAITYFDKQARPSNNWYTLDDWGSKNYGHRLCYYTKSYTGESINLTTQVMELDKVDTAVIQQIKDAIGGFGSIPIFASYLPYFSLAKAAVGFAESIVNFFNQDDEVIPFHNIDFHAKTVAAMRLLQSGRYVCIPSSSLTEDQIQREYKLEGEDNRLVKKSNGEEFNSSYFVLKVNSEHRAEYEEFDYLLGAAELLDQTNRGSNLQDIFKGVVETSRAISDMKYVREIEDLQYDTDDPNAKNKIVAFWKNLTPDMKGMYKGRYDEIKKEFD